MGSVVQEIVYGYKPTKEKIREIKAWANSEIIIERQRAVHEELKREEVKFGDKQIEEAVTFINFFDNGYFDLWKFFNNDSYRIIPDDQKEFIRRVNQGLKNLRGKVSKRKVCIIRNSDNEEVKIEEVGNLAEGAFSIKSKKLIIKHR